MEAPGLDPPEGGRNARKPFSMTKPIDIHTDRSPLKIIADGFLLCLHVFARGQRQQLLSHLRNKEF